MLTNRKLNQGPGRLNRFAIMALVASVVWTSCSAPRRLAVTTTTTTTIPVVKEQADPWPAEIEKVYQESLLDDNLIVGFGFDTDKFKSHVFPKAAARGRAEIMQSFIGRYKAAMSDYLNDVKVPAGKAAASSKLETGLLSMAENVIGNYSKVLKYHGVTIGDEYGAYAVVVVPKARLKQAFDEAITEEENLNLEFDRTRFFDAMRKNEVLK